MRTLVIEDDDDLRGELAEALRDAGHEVDTARDGAAALDALRSGATPIPELILLDLMMPNMDGQLFRLRQLADSRLSAIPTLVMTARPVDAATRLALGQTPVLAKPFDPETLLATLDEIGEPARAEKVCRCGRRYDRSGFRALRLIGEADNGRGAGERLELRLCLCNSTLAWELGRHALSIPMIRSSKPARSPE
jgi:DNA-binding response OmpR family regulator